MYFLTVTECNVLLHLKSVVPNRTFFGTAFEHLVSLSSYFPNSDPRLPGGRLSGQPAADWGVPPQLLSLKLDIIFPQIILYLNATEFFQTIISRVFPFVCYSINIRSLRMANSFLFYSGSYSGFKIILIFVPFSKKKKKITNPRIIKDYQSSTFGLLQKIFVKPMSSGRSESGHGVPPLDVD